MELLQNIDFANPTWLVIGCALLCVGGVILFIVLQIVGTGLGLITGILGAIFGFFQMGIGVATAGPIGCLGCLLTTALCGSCAAVTLAIIWVSPRCGTPEALIICRFLRY